MAPPSSRSLGISLLRLTALLTLVSAGVGGIPSVASATPGAELWTARYDGPADDDEGTALATSPDGSIVFVTGTSGSLNAGDYVTTAYDATMGVELWVRRYDGTANNRDDATAIAVSPDGSAVFVTGSSFGSIGAYNHDYATVAYDAVTGAQQWARRYDGPRDGSDFAHAVGVSPDGSVVFVTGSSFGPRGNSVYATLAYDAATGIRLWQGRYDVATNHWDLASSLRVSPDGSAVFVTGTTLRGSSDDYGTVAYDATTGAELWKRRFDGPASDDERAGALALSPDGSTLFVTGTSVGPTGVAEFATVAYDASDGSQRWVRRFRRPGISFGGPPALEVRPDGSAVFVAGYREGPTRRDYATLAYDATTGTRLWTMHYDGTGNGRDTATALGVSPDGSAVYVTGASAGTTKDDYATVAYDAVTGAERWVTRYEGRATDGATALAVSPDGSAVFVTGNSIGTRNDRDVLTVAYEIT